MHTNQDSTPGVLLRFPPISRTSVGWIALIVMLLAGSTYNAFAKILTDSLSPLSLVFVSEVLTASFVILTFGFIPIVREFRRLPTSKYLPLLAVGVGSSLLGPALIFFGLESTTAVNATLFGNTEMLFFLLLAIIILHERVHPMHAVSLAFILLGLLLISFHGFSEGFSFQHGDMLLILGSAVFSVGDMIFRLWLTDVDTHTVIFSRSVIAMTGILFLSLLLPHAPIAELRSFPLALIPALLGFAFFSRFLNLFSFYHAVDRLPVSTVSLVSHLGILISILFSTWLLAEPIFGYHVLGGAFIVGGTLLIEAVGKHHASRKHHLAHLRQRKAHRA